MSRNIGILTGGAQADETTPFHPRSPYAESLGITLGR